MITKNKPALKFRIKRCAPIIKQHIKPMLVMLFFICAYSIAGNMEYQDEVAQTKINCASATYANDNGGCE